MREEDQIDMMHDSHALWQEIDRLRAENDALKERLAVVEQIARLAPELNPNNYDHDEVCQLNDAMIALAKEAKS